MTSIKKYILICALGLNACIYSMNQDGGRQEQVKQNEASTPDIVAALLILAGSEEHRKQPTAPANFLQCSNVRGSETRKTYPTNYFLGVDEVEMKKNVRKEEKTGKKAGYKEAEQAIKRHGRLPQSKKRGYGKPLKEFALPEIKE